MTRQTARYGWLPDLPDHRDHRYTLPAVHDWGTVPSHVDLTAGMPPVYDQGAAGACTANAFAAAVQYQRPTLTPSRLFIYYGERLIEGSVSTDSGAMLRDGAKVLGTVGVCDESLWPYDGQPAAQDGQWPGNDRAGQEPSEPCFAAAKDNVAVSYQRVDQQADQMRAVLAQNTPIAVGFTVYASFESETTAATGIVQLPTDRESVMGGHAVLVVGYDDPTQRFLCRNSWGNRWGQAGYFTIPYTYLADPNLAGDFWTVTL